jgi:hypothetical protein
MVFSAPGEQKMDFRVHNTTWEPVDLDGIKLMRRPLPSARASKMSEKEDKGISGAKSRAERLYMADRMAKARARKKFQEGFVVLDIETTGTSPEKDEIIEVGALKIEADTVTEEFSMLIQIKGEIPIEIQKLTGITEQELQSQGRPLDEVLNKLFEFAGNRVIIGHNVMFDYNFIRIACRKLGIEMQLGTASKDTLALSRRKIKGVRSYQLDIAMFGMGPDAHFASLFPDHGEAEIDDPHVLVAGVRDSPKPPPLRLTLTVPMIARSKHTWVFTSEERKAGAVKAAFAQRNNPHAPSSYADGEELLWLIDEGAASKL